MGLPYFTGDFQLYYMGNGTIWMDDHQHRIFNDEEFWEEYFLEIEGIDVSINNIIKIVTIKVDILSLETESIVIYKRDYDKDDK